LERSFTIWYSSKEGAGGLRNYESYENTIKKVATFSTVEEFWVAYSHVMRPNKLSHGCDYHVFRTGIRPLWEDEQNRQGGKWVIRVKKNATCKLWEDLLLAVIGQVFCLPDEINGCVLSVRSHEDVISLWNSHSEVNIGYNQISQTLREVMGVPPSYPLRYKKHATSLKDVPSFRQTAPVTADVVSK
jgi:translation initiation factor 4E